MKVGILTLHTADSYGAVLQAYALQKALQALGAESKLLTLEKEQPTPAAQYSGLPAAFAERVRQKAGERAARFAAFRREHLIGAAPCPWAQAGRLNDEYDLFIAGSDQVWNPAVPGVDERYLLPFAPPEKRFSYAASFGTEALPAAQIPRYAAGLRDFRALSVREESGRRLIKELNGREAAVCLDPTLLPDPQLWHALTHAVEGPPYALLFLLQHNPELIAAAQAQARRQGLALRTVAAAFLPRFGFEAWSGAGVERWLSLIRHARCVFTDSFHGAVFALLFARPLRAARLTGPLRGRSIRLAELLRLAGLEQALTRLCPPPPPAVFAARIQEKRASSLAYLERILADGVVR